MKFGFGGLYFAYDRIFIMFKIDKKDFGHFYHDTRVDARFYPKHLNCKVSKDQKDVCSIPIKNIVQYCDSY
jgi:hypothetical protein